MSTTSPKRRTPARKKSTATDAAPLETQAMAEVAAAVAEPLDTVQPEVAAASDVAAAPAVDDAPPATKPARKRASKAKPAAQAVAPAAEPVVVPDEVSAEPVAQATVEAAAEVTVEAAPEASADAATEPAAEPAAKPAKPARKRTRNAAEVADVPVAEEVAAPVAAPAAEPTEPGATMDMDVDVDADIEPAPEVDADAIAQAMDDVMADLMAEPDDGLVPTPHETSAAAPDTASPSPDLQEPQDAQESQEPQEPRERGSRRGRRKPKSAAAADGERDAPAAHQPIALADSEAEHGYGVDHDLQAETEPEPEPEPTPEPPPPPPPLRHTLGPREDDSLFGDYELRAIDDGATCTVRLRGRHAWRCDCAGYLAQGDCEHGSELLRLLDPAQLLALDAGWPAREAEVWLVPGPQRQLQWVPGHELPAALRDQYGLDERGRLPAEQSQDWLQAQLEQARIHGFTLRVDGAVWPQLAWGRDAQARVQRIEALMGEGEAMAQLLREPLPVHQWEAALFAACAGRALLADDLGLGQRGAAIAAIQLFARLFGVAPVLVIAPQASHDAWQRDLQRWLGEVPAAVTLAAQPPARLNPMLLVVDGVDLLSAEQLEALRARAEPHLLLLANTEPLADERLGAWVDWLDSARRGPLAWLQSLPADAGKRQKREALETVLLSRRKREMADQLPPALLQPLWLPAAGNALPAAAVKQLRQTLARWQELNYLGSADQHQLLEALALLPPASRQALAAKAEAVLALRRDWTGQGAAATPGATPAAARLLVCARSETWLDSLAQSPQMRRLAPQRLRAGDTPQARDALLQAWQSAEAGVLLASDAALATLQPGQLADTRLALVHADLPWQAAAQERRLRQACGDDARGVPAALLLIQDSLDAALISAQRAGVDFPAWLDAAPAWLEPQQLQALMAALKPLVEGL